MNNIRKNILAVVLLTVLFGCDMDDFFELERPQETQWVNTVTFEQGLADAYHSLLYYTNPGFHEMVDFCATGVSQLLPGTSTGAPWNEMYNRLYSQIEHAHHRNFWRDQYQAITMCNLALELDEEGDGNMFNLDKNDSDYTDNYVRQIGEYHFVRAYAYYSLVRFFAAPYDHNGSNDGTYIPFHTNFPRSKEAIYDVDLGTNEEIYQQIIDDLLVAKDMLPDAYNSTTMFPTYEAGRGTSFAATALLAKVYFIMGRYTEAIAELNEIIASAEVDGQFFMDEPIEAFNKNTPTDIPREIIWEFNGGTPGVNWTYNYMFWGWIISLQDRNADDFGRGAGMSKTATNQFTYSYYALDKMGWMVDPLNGDYTLSTEAQNDLRFQQIHWYLLPYLEDGDPLVYETVFTHSAVTTPQLYIDKYYRGGPGDGRYSKFPIIRLAEMYLIRSWLNWNNGDLAEAASDLNVVWNRANPSSPDRYNTGNIDHDAILGEFYKEMSGEGVTMDFIVGTQMPLPPGDEDRAPVNPPYSEWHWAIPVEETSLNPDFQTGG